MSKQNNKLGVVAITVLLILFAVLTNDKSFEYNFSLVAVISYLMFCVILPFIEKKSMIFSSSILENKKDNVEFRLILMVIAVVFTILSLYKLLSG